MPSPTVFCPPMTLATDSPHEHRPPAPGQQTASPEQTRPGFGVIKSDELPSRDPDLLVGEQKFRTFVSGRWKSSMRRSDGTFHLFDRHADPAETRDVATQHPEIVRDHLVRANEISKSLRATAAAREELTESDRSRLRLLGYLE